MAACSLSGGRQNNLHELWALLNFLLPDVFSSSEQFDEVSKADADATSAAQELQLVRTMCSLLY